MTQKAVFEPRNPDFAEKARATFEGQGLTRALGMKFESVAAGEFVLSLERNERVLQHLGFIHGGVLAMGLDNACGFAAMTCAEKGFSVLTIEFKTNFIAPAGQERIIFRGHVIKPGKRVIFTESAAYGIEGVSETLLATMAATVTLVPEPVE